MDSSHTKSGRVKRSLSALLSPLLVGVLFGLCFPLLGTILECYRRDLYGLAGVVQVHRETPLLWIIDTAPIVLGFAGYLIGFREDAIVASGTLSTRRRLLPLGLVIAVVLAGSMMAYAIREGRALSRMASDIERAGSLRDRILWIQTNADPQEQTQYLDEIRATRRHLRTFYPTAMERTDAAWDAYYTGLLASGKPEWGKTRLLWSVSDALTKDLAAQVTEQHQRLSEVLLYGAIGLMLLLPLEAILLYRLWRSETVLTTQNTKLIQAADDLARSESRFRTIVEVMSDWIWEADREHYTYVSPQVLSALGYSPDALIGRTPFDFMPEREAARVRAVSAEIVTNHRPFKGLECEMIAADGRTIYQEVSGSPVYDANGTFIGYRGINRDITQRRLAEQERALYQAHLEEMATTDSLTGLKNRRVFVERLEMFWALGQEHALSLIILDADKFKSYNDTFGHLEGDAVLKKLAEVLWRETRPGDLVARYGGEEFVILLPDTDGDATMVVAERIRRAIETSGDFARPITVSLGVATRTRRMLRSTSLISAADEALYLAKSAGRNRAVQYFELSDVLSR